jgi:succinyl-diaminopimelate desuccinylase
MTGTSRLVETLEWLINIPSVTRDEQQIADLVQHRLAQNSAQLVRRWRHGLLATPLGKSPKLLLVGHLDTVPPSALQTRRREGGRVYGCGASDMKAGVAVMLELFEQQPEAPVAYLFYDREEGPLAENGLLPLLDLLPPPAQPTTESDGSGPPSRLGLPAVVLEPTNNEVQVGCVGSFHLAVRFQGVRSHAARPWQGRNAIYEALPLLEYLAHRAPDDIQVQGQNFRQVITPTIMSTPTLANAVPEEARINLNIRFAPGIDHQSLIDEVAGQAGPHATVKLLDVAPAGAVCHTEPLFAAWIAERGLTVTPKQAWTDVAQLTARGYPAVNFGPGEPAQAHQPDEWTPEAALEECYQHLLALLLQS